MYRFISILNIQINVLVLIAAAMFLHVHKGAN